ncbi:MAG: cupin domain-containing protein [Nitrososphaerota archaeon]|nr:cupin domain-containing protein [Nitrososphaerota archaeon]
MDSVNQERITSKGIDIWIERTKQPTKLTTAAKTEVIPYASMTPPNMLKPDGETLKLLVGDGVSVELSKRRSTMTFWHRNMDYDEVIICVKGGAKWSTEGGEFQLKAGEMLFIPRGVSHSASSDKDSEYMAIEIKSKIPLTYSKPQQ